MANPPSTVAGPLRLYLRNFISFDQTGEILIMGRRLAGTCGLAGVALTVALGTAACGGNTAAATSPLTNTTHGSNTTSAAASPTATATATSAGTAAGTAPATTSAARTTTAAAAVPACGNEDLRISFGYGTQSEPLQASAVVFKNISSHTCTLQGYPGAAIKDGDTTIDASRVLNGFRGDLPPLSSPPLVTLAPGGVSYAVLEWRLHTDQSCYPTGTGSFEITAPNTTKTVTISTAAHFGQAAICSSFETNPVVPGVFGISVGN
jgi:Protein of unknown function (DUF4232)